jgi:hypothetical protein
MKEIKNIFWLLSICLSVLCSCSTDNNDNVKYLKKVVEVSDDGTSATSLFIYNGDEIVSIDGVHKHTDFTYTDGLITKIVTLDKESQELETIEYSYIEGRLVSVKSLNNYRINYVHNSDGTVSYEKWSLNLGNEGVKISHGTLYFQNENLVKDERIIENTGVGVVSNYSISFEYDSKKNPLFAILGYKKLLNHNQRISLNNSLVSIEVVSITREDQITSSANFYKSTFKYDSDGYPTEQVSERALFDNGTAAYLKTQYFYK